MGVFRHRLPAYMHGITELSITLLRKMSGGVLFGLPKQDREVLDSVFANKTCLITGADRGIGAELAETLAFHGARIIFAGRSEDSALQTIEGIQQRLSKMGKSGQEMHFVHLELTSLNSVRSCCETVRSITKQIDFIFLNAGIFGRPLGVNQGRVVTEDGFEEHFQVNYLSQWLLTRILLEQQQLLRGKMPKTHQYAVRVLILSSCVHFGGELDFNDINTACNYSTFRAYADSKLATVLHAKYLQSLMDRSECSSDTAVAIHPGEVNTQLAKQWMMGEDILGKTFQPFLEAIGPVTLPYLLISTEEAVRTILFAASAPKDKAGGAYVASCQVTPSSPGSYCTSTAKQLWEFSLRATNSHRNYLDYGLP